MHLLHIFVKKYRTLPIHNYDIANMADMSKKFFSQSELHKVLVTLNKKTADT